MSRYEVRCCCDPGKLIGWLDLSGAQEDLALKERAVAIPLLIDMPSLVDLHRRIDAGETVRMETACLLVRLRELRLAGWGDRYLAVYSDDHPIETWSRVRGFEAARAHD